MAWVTLAQPIPAPDTVMPINLPGWLTRPYTLVTGCAICSGLAVGLIEDVRHQVTDALYTLVFPAPRHRHLCATGRRWWAAARPAAAHLPV